MGKKENLYVKEYVDYYLKLGIDKLFIYDDNEPNTEKISDIVGNLSKKIKIYENRKKKIKRQSQAYNDCYKNNKANFDWFLMIDMDEFLVIVNNTLKKYLSNKIFKKCDFIKFHWVFSNDNNLIYYDNRSLFERFKGPYTKSQFIKSIIRGNINRLKYSVHSPKESPEKNITCNNIGKVIKSKIINFEYINPINIDKAFIIHFKFKSTEEFIRKYKRGYKNWFGNHTEWWKNQNIIKYFKYNKITLEKIKFLERELKLNLTKYKKFIK